MSTQPDVVIIMTDEERAAPPYESERLRAWRRDHLPGAAWFDANSVSFDRHYTGSLACVPSRPTLFTGQYPDVHGVTQTDGLGKMADDSRMRWMRPGEVPTLGNWFRAAGYDTHYDGKWHITHADLTDPDTGAPIATNTHFGDVIPDAVDAYLRADPATGAPIATNTISAMSSPMRSMPTSAPTRSARSGSPAGSDPSRTGGCTPTRVSSAIR